MDTFVYRITKSDAAGYLKIDDIAGESRFDPGMTQASDETFPAGMHVDPVIPGNTADIDTLTMPRVLGRVDPLDGVEDPLPEFQQSLTGLEDPLFG